MSVFYEKGNTPAYYNYVDALFGIIFILLFFSSTFLNLVILAFNRTKKTNSALLYSLLAGSNLAAAILHPPLMAYNFLHPNSVLPSGLMVVSSFVAAVFINSGGGILTLLAATRLFTLKYPLRGISKRRCNFLVVVVLFVCLAESLMQLGESHEKDFSFHFSNQKQFIINPNYTSTAFVTPLTVMIRVVFSANMCLCVCICAYTGRMLCRTKQVKGSNNKNLKRSTITILYMNGIYTSVLVYMVVLVIIVFIKPPGTVGHLYFTILSFLAFPFVPLLLSVTNPAITILRGKDIKGFVRQRAVRQNTVNTGNHSPSHKETKSHGKIKNNRDINTTSYKYKTSNRNDEIDVSRNGELEVYVNNADIRSD